MRSVATTIAFGVFACASTVVCTAQTLVMPKYEVSAGVRLGGPGRQHERLPCFWFSRSVGVLPAFGDFTGLSDVEPLTGDRVFVIARDEVLEVPV